MKIDVIVVRDPDGDVDVEVFVDGRATHQMPDAEDTVVVVDSGRGWTRDDWNAARNAAAASVHPRVAKEVRGAFDAEAESPFIEDRRDSEF